MVPAMVTEAVPLAVNVPPPAVGKVNRPVPLVTLTVVVRLALLESATLIPVIASAVSSGVTCVPGTVLTGVPAVLTSTLTLAVSVTPPDVTV